MAAIGSKYLPVGSRFANVWALNTNGRPLANSHTVSYTGLQAEGAKGLTVTVPEPRKITHSGDDRPLAVDFLPALEAGSAELHVAKSDLTLQALLAGVLVSTIGESQGMLYATDKQGFEPVVGLMIYQQALDAGSNSAANGLRRWRSVWMPKAKLVLMPHGTDDNPADLVYKVAPLIVRAHLWGTAFTNALDGATEAQYVDRITEGIPFLDSFLGSGAISPSASSSLSDSASASKSPSASTSPSAGAVAGEYVLSHTALSTAKIAVFQNGVLRTSGLILTTTSVQITTNRPLAAQDVNIFYEF